MKLELTQKQTTGLIMTTEIRQAISLLQYSTIDLWSYIQDKSMENPAITLDAPSIDMNIPTRNRSHQSFVNPVEFCAARDKGWREDLADQLKWQFENEADQMILRYLILNLDDKGFLPLKSEEIALNLSVTEEAVNQSLILLKHFENKGLGCYDMKDFLLFQIVQNGEDQGLLYKIVSEHLHELADRKWKQLSKKLGYSQKQIQAAFIQLKTLQPHPNIESMKQPTRYIVPDLVVRKEGDHYVITDPNSITPYVKINDSLANLSKHDQKAAAYIDECYKEASWLMRSLEQRKTTILKVAEVIVQKQGAFFNGGSLQPLTLKQVAAMIGMHESTVSRAVANKFVQTPKGMFELKTFFTTGLAKTDEATISTVEVKKMMKQWIDEEDKSRPLSDQKIADRLKREETITISRRTVAKYREAMNILSSSKRKE